MSEGKQAAVEATLDNPSRGAEGVVEYQPGNSFLHRLRPVTKVVLVIGFTVVVFLLSDFRGPLLVLLFLLGMLIVFGIFKEIARTAFLISLPLGISLLTIHGLFNPRNQTPLFVVEPVPVLGTFIVWKEGIQFGLLFYFRLLTMIVAVLTLIKTTHPRKLSVDLAEMGVPNNLAYVLLAALQLVPQMNDQARAIADAQQARGLDTRANLRERFKSLIAMVTPLFISMLITTQTRALALESKGFSREGERTYLLEVTDTALDRVLRWGTAVVVAGVFIWQVII